MKFNLILLLVIIALLPSCVEKEEVYPRPAETITLHVSNDTSMVLLENQTFILNAETGDITSIYSWYHNGYNCSNTPSVIANSPGLYEVKINSDTVYYEFAIYIFNGETSMYYPNSFSPNGDMLNDFWGIFGINIDANSILVRIYDQNDHLLFESYELGYVWNGAVDGVKCPVGTYYYVVKYKTLNGENHKDSGMLQLIE